MDHKSWLWGKKATQKTNLATDKANLNSKENGEVQAPLTDKEKLEKDLKRLNDKLAFTLSECNAKDEQLKKQTKIVEEAVAGWEKAEAEILSMKQHLEESIQQQLVYEERVAQLDGALKECMQQLRFVREEQEQRIHDAVMKASKEFVEVRVVLEEQLSETSKGLAKSGVENSRLNKSIIAKENLIEDLKRQLAHAESDHNALMIRLESIEKDNASLKYEAQVLEKELAIRNEEREFNRRTADASHKQYLQSVKKIAKLESECQRLCLMVRKRLPSQASLAKMKNEVEMLEQDSFEMRRTNLNSTNLVVESSLDSSPETTIRRITALTEQLCAVEEENKTLKESLTRKTNEVQFSRVMLARTASKLMRLESEIESRHLVTLEQPRSNLALQDLSFSSMSDIGSDDKVSCADSWASALISELEHFRSVKQKESLSCKSVGPSDISLMDDFLEMEKLAVVSVEKAPEILHASLEENNEIKGPLETRPNEIISEVIGKEVITVSDHLSEFSTSNQESYSNSILKGEIPGWLLDVVKVILEQNCVTHKNLDGIREDIRLALSYLNNADQYGFDSSKVSGQFDATKPLHLSQHTSWEPLNNSLVDPCGEVNHAEILSMKGTKQQSQRDLSKSVGKLIELIEGISMPSEDYDNSDSLYKRDGNSHTHKNHGGPAGYMVRVFQWKTSELSNVLQQFLHVCYDLINDKADHEKFATELTTALDWIMNHCFSLQDVSSMRDAIKKQFDWDETLSENEAETGMFADTNRLHLPREQLSCLPSVTNLDCHDVPSKEVRYVDKEELVNIKDKVISSESEQEALEGRLQSATNQLQESEKTIGSLRLELQTLKELNRIYEDQMQNHALIKEDLNTQLTETELKEANHKVLALEVELENKSQYCEELETRCVELQLLLESMTKKSDNDVNQKDEPLRTDWEITAASEKLAECQETIFNLGKQLKALAAPKDASLFDNAIATQHHTIANTNAVPLKDMKAKNRSSLFDQMMADDDTKAKGCKASERSSSPSSIPGFKQPLEKILLLNGLKGQDDSPSVNSMAIVPAKKSFGRNFWRRLFGRKKSKKKTHFSLNT
ncbi:filament-like plant protein 7 [Cajanus cajan]|uniref:filament-like plant protein 7 n=1 Tax=Cajanus cajan TaxID=3821 RepID=UPI00098DCAF0|nr:filament-like plant protein 7 [Cajanus cajan]XP_020217111.1 filament-like plant protein 7 [Cajanus cajan]